jgi:hypothetical protein
VCSVVRAARRRLCSRNRGLLPQYPLEPPDTTFVPPAPIHPHIYSNGCVAHSSARGAWGLRVPRLSVCAGVLQVRCAVSNASRRRARCHDEDKGQLGISTQFDLTGAAAPGAGGGSVPGRGTLTLQPVTKFFVNGMALWDNRDRNGYIAAIIASQQHLQPRERMQQRFADASSAAGGPGP